MRPALLLVLCALLTTVPVEAQRRRAPAPTKPAPPPPAALKTEPAAVKCAELLGTGIKTHATFCFVLAGRDPAQGVLVSIPPHTGTATLTFSLHNRHTYSEEEMKAGQGFAKYTAVIGVLSMTGDLLGRGAVQSEFRAPKDLYDRVSGGAGPGGVKAVAPIGNEAISITIGRDADVGLQRLHLGAQIFQLVIVGLGRMSSEKNVAIVMNALHFNAGFGKQSV